MAEIALTEKTQEEAKDERPVVLKVDHVRKKNSLYGLQ